MKNVYKLLMLLISITTFSQVGIGTTNPNSKAELDIVSTTKGVLIPRMTEAQRIAINPVITENGMLVYQIDNNTGFYFYNGTTWASLGGINYWQRTGTNLDVANANDDIVFSSDETSITFPQVSGTSAPMINMFGASGNTGNRMVLAHSVNNPTWGLEYNDADDAFNFLQSGTKKLEIDLTGTTSLLVWGDTDWFDEGGTGQITAKISDVGNEGSLVLYNNGSVQHRFDAGFSSVINEQGLDLDFRIESNTNTNAFGVNAGNDIMYAGNAAAGLPNNGGTINGNTIDYVAAFYTSGSTNGTAVQFGSTEYIMDSGNLEMSVYASWLPYYPMGSPAFTLGNAAQRWSAVWAINGVIQTSDITLKKNIKSLNFGLKEVLQLNPISYQWKEGLDKTTKIGFSAQQLLKIIPDVVVTHSYVLEEEGKQPILKKNEKLGVNYSEIIPILTKAIQEQNELIKVLEKRIKKLEK